MSSRARFTAAVAACLAATLLLIGNVFAHAAITSVSWDNPSSPSRVVASTGGEEISNAAGDFYLRVLNSAGTRVDRNDAAVDAANTGITVSVQPNLPAGTYRVEWKTVSEDGHSETGVSNLTLGTASPAATTTTPSAPSMPAAAAPVAAHTHDADDHTHDAAPTTMTSMPSGPMATSAAMPTAPVTFEVNLTGAKQVPAPVSSAASGFARFTFNPSTRRLDYAVWVRGVSPNLVTGLHLHRGAANQTGPHIFDIINAPFTTVSGSTVLSPADVADLLAGRIYLNLHTTEFPSGAARGQLILPAAAMAGDHDHSDHDHAAPARPSVRPPSTGDAGLVSNVSPDRTEGIMVASIVVSVFAALVWTRKASIE